MPKIQQPSNQIKLTNVAIVRLRQGGKRFEIACYKNKVQEWRNGVETNLDDVLQIHTVFINVSKGEVAKTGDLFKAFGKMEQSDIVKEILNKGEVQVGEKEREHDLTSLRKEIATLVSEKCVDPATQHPYPVGIIEKAMAEAGFSVKPNKTAKSQVSECIRLIQIQSCLSLQRSRMRIKVTIPVDASGASEANPVQSGDVIEGGSNSRRKNAPKEKVDDSRPLKDRITELADKIEYEEKVDANKEKVDANEGKSDVTCTITMLIDPGRYKELNDLLQKMCKGLGRLEILSLGVTEGSSKEK